MTKVWITACYPGYYKVVDGKWLWAYTGGTHKAESVLLGVKRRVSFLELYDILEQKLGIDSRMFELVLRCPSLHGPDFPPCIIKDDCGVNALISCWKAPIMYITVKPKSAGDPIYLTSNDHVVVDEGGEGSEGAKVVDVVKSFVDEGGEGSEAAHANVHTSLTVYRPLLVDKLIDIGPKEVDTSASIEVDSGAAAGASNANVHTSLTVYRPLLVDKLIEIGLKEVDSGAVNVHTSSVRILDVEDLHVNDYFETKLDLLYKLHKLALKYHFEFFTPRSTRKLCITTCVQKQCEWRMRATTDGNSKHFVVRSYDFKHGCSLSVRKIDHRQATAKVIAILLAPKLLDRNRVFKVKDVISDFYQETGYTVSYPKAFNGLHHARVMIRGNPRVSFEKLPKFFYALESRNPGTVTSIETVKVGESDAFIYCFMALGASISGYKSSVRPVISVDGTFLTGVYKGTLIVAICQDGNHQLFPIAFGVVNSENNESWTWFFQKLKAITGDFRELAILSDGAASIKHGFNEVFQNACHGRCTYHLQKNLKKKCPRSDVTDLFNLAARAYTVEKFKRYFEALCDKHPLIRGYLEEENFRYWSRAHFDGLRYNIMITNHAESVNSMLKTAKWFPIVALLSEIRDILQRWFAERRDEALQCETILTPTMEDELMKTFDELRDLNSVKKVVAKAIIGHCKYEVCVVGKPSYIVDFDTRTCTCRKFDLEKMPCIHAVVAAREAMIPVYDLCSDYYKTSYWRKTYVGLILPLPNEDEEAFEYPEQILNKKVLPPVLPEEKKVGRPQGTDREPGAGEPRKKGRNSKKTRVTRKESLETRKKYKKKPGSQKHPEIQDEHVIQRGVTSKKSKRKQASMNESIETRKKYKKKPRTRNEQSEKWGDLRDEHVDCGTSIEFESIDCGDTSVRAEHHVDCETGIEFESVDTDMEADMTISDIVKKTCRKRPKFGSIKSLLA